MSIVEILQYLAKSQYFVELTTDSGSVYEGYLSRMDLDNQHTGILEITSQIDDRAYITLLSFSSIEAVSYYSDRGTPSKNRSEPRLYVIDNDE